MWSIQPDKIYRIFNPPADTPCFTFTYNETYHSHSTKKNEGEKNKKHFRYMHCQVVVTSFGSQNGNDEIVSCHFCEWAKHTHTHTTIEFYVHVASKISTKHFILFFFCVKELTKLFCRNEKCISVK